MASKLVRNGKKPDKILKFEEFYVEETGMWTIPERFFYPQGVFKKTPEQIAGMRDTLKQDPQHIFGASVEVEVANCLYWIARLTSAQRILETGSNQGYSTSMLALAARDNAGQEVVSIDVNANTFIYQDTELEQFVNFRHGSSLEVDVDGTFDMMLLDSDHTYGTIMQEVIRFEPMLKTGGILCFHDSILFDAIGMCVKQVMETGRFETLNLNSPRKTVRPPGLTIMRKVVETPAKPDLSYHEEFAKVAQHLTPKRSKSHQPWIEENHPLKDTRT